MRTQRTSTPALPRHTLAALATLAALLAAPARAQPPEALVSPAQVYLGTRMGVARPLGTADGTPGEWRFGRGQTGAIAAGVSLDGVALEGELSLVTLDAGADAGAGRSGDAHLASLMVAGRWLPRLNAMVYGVAGLGAGVTRVEWDQVRDARGALHAEDEVLALAAEAGLGTHFWEPMSFELTYRYLGLGDYDYVDAAGAPGRVSDARHGMLVAGMRYELD